MDNFKKAVYDYWNHSSCGEDLYLKGEIVKQQYINQANHRYYLEPQILSFADLPQVKTKRSSK